MITALEVERHEDLRGLSRWLRARGIPHRIFEADGRLKLVVPDERMVAYVRDAWDAAQRGELEHLGPGPTPQHRLGEGLRRELRAHPATAALVALNLLLFPASWSLAEGHIGPVLGALLIVPVERLGEFLQFTDLGTALGAGQFWRLWTPALLHFSVLHLVFNLLWLWEFGRRIELGQGGIRFLEVVLFLAPVSNYCQYLAGAGPIFGGMSGVVYGLLGYLMTAWRRTGDPVYRLPTPLVVALLLLLVFFSTGITEPFGLRIANAAHWGGFVAGVLWGWVRVRPRTGSGRSF